jgi:hypothetical protein
MRHRGRAAAAGRARFGKFRDFRLHVQGKIARDLGKRGGEQAVGGCGLADAFALGLPGNARKRKAQIFRQQRSNLRSAIVEGCQSSGCAPELQGERMAEQTLQAGRDGGDKRRASPP